MTLDIDDDMLPWQELLKRGVELYLKQMVTNGPSTIFGYGIDSEHLKDTPSRVVRAFTEHVSGYLEDPRAPLKKQFKGEYDQMVHRRNIRLVSRCAHHLEPIFGTAHFAYVPNGAVVGLSKIPRFIRILAKRLQVQEELGEQIVNLFQEEVKPLGCAVVIKAYHFCEMARGVREDSATTVTTSLRGCFKSNREARAEFYNSIDYTGSVF